MVTRTELMSPILKKNHVHCIFRSGKASPVAFYEVSAPMAEEIKSITSSIVTHTEKLWVTSTQAPPSGAIESTFSADGKNIFLYTKVKTLTHTLKLLLGTSFWDY